jgi:nucleoid-associated protein YgaU
MINRDSRYYTGPLVQVQDSRTGNFTIAVNRRFPRGGYVSFLQYTWVDGDQIDQIASVYLGDPKLWTAIMDVNPTISDAFSIRPGTEIRIPNG